jgi:hypothetical protein
MPTVRVEPDYSEKSSLQQSIFAQLADKSKKHRHKRTQLQIKWELPQEVIDIHSNEQ